MYASHIITPIFVIAFFLLACYLLVSKIYVWLRKKKGC